MSRMAAVFASGNAVAAVAPHARQANDRVPGAQAFTTRARGAATPLIALRVSTTSGAWRPISS